MDLLVKQSKEILQDAEKYIKEKHTDYKRQNDLIFVGRSLGSIVAGSEGRVVASMIDCGTGFEVVNKDLLICNLSKNSSIEIKMRVQYGIGYVQSSKSSSSRYDLDGIIPVDAIYNPVKKVNFFVEQSKDVVGCERLIMHVETDGSISHYSKNPLTIFLRIGLIIS